MKIWKYSNFLTELLKYKVAVICGKLDLFRHCATIPQHITHTDKHTICSVG